MYRAYLCLLVLTISSCTLVDWGQDPDQIVLVNGSGELIFFKALELQMSHTFDPILSFDPTESSLPGVEPGDAVEVQTIEGYTPGDDVRFFIYSLRQAKDDEPPMVVFTTVLTVTQRELRQSRGHVFVGEL